MRPHFVLRRRLRLASLGGIVGLVGLMAACGASDATVPGADQGALVDSGVIGDLGLTDLGPLLDVGLDASVDAGVGTLDGLYPADEARFAPFLDTVLGTWGGVSLGAPAPWVSCYDADLCHTAACAELATCCVGEGECAAPQTDATLPTALPFSTCASGSSALSCLSGAPLVALGSSAPTVESGGLRPGGDANSEGGVVVGSPFDLRQDRVDLSVVFMAPVTCPGGACLESAGVSLARSSELALGVVSPALGLVYSPTRGDVSLVIGDQRRASWPLGDESVPWTLEAHPTGLVRVWHGSALQPESLSYLPIADAQVALHGRNTELAGARIRSFSALRYRSEAPDLFGGRQPLTLSAPSGVAPWNPRTPSVSESEGAVYVVVENDGAIYRGSLLTPTATEATFDVMQRLVLDGSRDERAMRSPTMVVRPGGETFVFYAAELIDGTRVVRARHGLNGPLGDLPDVLAVASALGDNGDSLDAPAVLEWQGRWLALLRRTVSSPSGAGGAGDTGDTHLELWISDQEVEGAPTLGMLNTLAPAPASNLAALTRVSAADGAQESLSEPHLSVRGGTYRVHLTRQRGTRSALELLVSDELRAWRSFGVVVAPQAGTQDALGAASASALQSSDGVETLYYVGRDGVTEALLRTSRDGVLDPPSLRAP